jgi:hypothetical protein
LLCAVFINLKKIRETYRICMKQPSVETTKENEI